METTQKLALSFWPYMLLSLLTTLASLVVVFLLNALSPLVMMMASFVLAWVCMRLARHLQGQDYSHQTVLLIASFGGLMPLLAALYLLNDFGWLPKS
ncbi:MAG TPA: hypothetical protein VLE72_03735 [Candidatus Saccharimonadales bacterium]|nr:hypothetical protein [Candidatus Saccharimonadales bacterium]